MDLNENITSSELKKLQEKYNKPRDPKQQKKYQQYKKIPGAMYDKKTSTWIL